MSNKTNLRPGDLVHVVQASGGLGDTVYKVRELDGADSHYCWISEVAKSGELYKPQYFVCSLLQKVLD